MRLISLATAAFLSAGLLLYAHLPAYAQEDIGDLYVDETGDSIRGALEIFGPTSVFNAGGDTFLHQKLWVFDDANVGRGLKVVGASQLLGRIYNPVFGKGILVDDDFRAKGNARIDGRLHMGGPIFNPNGAVLVKDRLNVTGGLFDSAGALVLADNVRIHGKLNVQREILNTKGAVVVDDTLGVKGRAKVRRLTVVNGASFGGPSIFTGDTFLRGVANPNFVLDKGSAVGDTDVSLRFSDDGVNDAHALMWDDGDDRFEFGADTVQATSFIAGSASTTLADGSLGATGALAVSSGGGTDLTLDSDSGTVILGAGTNTIKNTDGANLVLDSVGKIVSVEGTNDFEVGGGYGDTGFAADSSGNVYADGNLLVDGDIDFADGSGGDTITIGDAGDTVTIEGADIDSTISETFTVDSDAAGTEPADGSGYVIEGGTGDVSMLWNATDDEIEFTFGGSPADIQGGSASFSALDVSGATSLGSSVDIDAETVQLDADAAGIADVDVGLYFNDDGTSTAHAFLWDDGDDRFELGADSIQATSFMAGASTTTLADGSLSDTDALEISSGGSADLVFVSGSRTIYLDDGTDWIESTTEGPLTVTATGGEDLRLAPTGAVLMGGGYASTGVTVNPNDGGLSASGLGIFDGGLNVAGVFTVDASGNVIAVDLTASGAVDFSTASTIDLGTAQVDSTEIADLTRTIMPGLFDWRTDDTAPISIDNATVPEPVGFNGTNGFSGLEWLSGSTGTGNGIAYQFKVPSDFASGMTFHALVVDTNNVADGATADDLTFEWVSAKAGEATNPTAVNEGAVSASNTDTFTELTWALDGGTVEADDFLKADLYWSALDETMYISQLWFEYTATQ